MTIVVAASSPNAASGVTQKNDAAKTRERASPPTERSAVTQRARTGGGLPDRHWSLYPLDAMRAGRQPGRHSEPPTSYPPRSGEREEEVRGAAPSPDEDPLSPWSAPLLLVFVATTGLGFFLVTLRYWIPTSTVRDATDEPIVDDRTHGDVVDRRPPRVAVVLFVLLLSAGGAGFLLGRWVGMDGTVASRTATRD